MQRSESIAKLAEALAAAQGEIGGAAKTSANPFFKSKYADLSSIMDACKGPLSKHGLAVMQFPRSTEAGVEVETLLVHASGEWVSETLSLPVAKEDAQGIGSAITYARRYSLGAFAGVCPEDDDGNAATQSQNAATHQTYEKQALALEGAAKQGSEALRMIWESMSVPARKVHQQKLQLLKSIALKVDEGVNRGTIDKLAKDIGAISPGAAEAVAAELRR